ncbi:MAG: hypothetical protein FJ225_01950 [Lentisphaerae bacterium]|nr:hypothetical protein [Lentisphaerota bacterium]
MSAQINNTMPAEDWKRELVEIFFARSGIIWSVTFVVFACAVAIVLFWPPTFEATGSVLMQGRRPPSSPTSLEVSDVRVFDLTEQDVASELEILTSPELVRRALEDVGAPKADAQEMAARVRGEKGKLRTEVVPASHVIRIAYRNRSDSRAEAFLEALLGNYVPFRSAKLNPMGQHEFLSKRAEEYREKLEQVEDKLMESARMGSLASLEEEMTSNVTLKRELSTRLADLRDNFVASKFLENKEMEARMKMLSIGIMELEDRNEQLQRTAIEIRRAMREAEMLEYSFKTYARRAEQAEVEQGFGGASLSADVAVLTSAAMSAVRVFPQRVMTLLLGLIVGFITGCSLGFVVEFLDHTVRKPEDVERYSGLPVVFSITKC